MVYDLARVRGLYTSLGDGWTYLSQPQVPERVSSAVARGFRLATVMTTPKGGQLGAVDLLDSARLAISDLTGTSPEAVVLGPSLDVLYARLNQALQPVLRRGSLLASRADVRQIYHTDVTFAEADLGTGEVPAWQYESLATGATRLATLSAVHPQVGTINDVARISEIIRRHTRAWVLVDASGLAGFSSIAVDDLGVDIVALDCADFGGPQIAAVAFRDVSMFPRMDMGAFVNDAAPGLAAGVPAAVDHLADLVEQERGSRRQRLEKSLDEVGHYLKSLAEYLADSLNSMFRLHVFGVTGELAVGSNATRIPRVTFCIPGVPAQTIYDRLLDNRLVTKIAPADPLLNAMGLSESDGAITVSLGPYNTTYDVDQLIRVLASLA